MVPSPESEANHPEHPALATVAAARRRLAGGDPTGSRQVLQEALGRHPGFPELLESLGYLELQLGETALAARHLTEACEAAPGGASAWIGLALACRALQRFPEFRRARDRVMELNPEWRDYMHVIRHQPPRPAEPGDPRAADPASPETPVIFVHFGNPTYLAAAIESAQRFNRRVILIGDEKNAVLSDRVTHVDIARHFEQAHAFQALYEHMSTNHITVERFCFMRWFALRDYLDRNGLEVCLYLDSDVLLFANATREYHERFAGARLDFTLSAGSSGHTSYMTRAGLGRFCDFVWETYANKTGERYQSLLRLDRRLREAGERGGITDMTLLELYKDLHPERVGETTEIVNGATYDHNFNRSAGYEMIGEIKRVFFFEDVPFVRHLERDRFIRFASLHFQGVAKFAVPIVTQLRDSRSGAAIEKVARLLATPV